MKPIEQFSLLKHYETITSTNTNAMTHSLREQIQAIQEAREMISRGECFFMPETNEQAKLLASRLNDAGSTIAALNLTKDITNPARDEYFEQLMDLVEKFFTESYAAEDQTKERILSITYDKVEELETKLKNKK